MMTMTPTNEIQRIGRKEAHALALEEFARFAAGCASLDVDDWARPTDCAGWDVRAVALHILGSAEAQASTRELIHQFRRGLPLNKQIDSHHWVDGINELQLRDRAQLTNAELVDQLAAIGPKAVKGRWHTPPPIRWMPVPFGPPVGVKPLKYLLDVGFTRDVWMHRIDVAVAIGRPPQVTAEHDGRLVADIIAEWAGIHRQPFTLAATGTAGGGYRQGDDGEHVDIDAIELCRVLAGRAPGTGVLANPLPL